MTGILLVFLGGSAWGESLERQMKKRWQILRELCEVLRYLEKEMIFHRTPLQEAMLAASQTGSLEISELLNYTAREMGQRKGISFREIWQEGTKQVLGNGVLKQQEREAVADCWNAFCNADVVMQKTMMEKQLLRMENLCREAEAEYREKTGLYRKLGAVGGIFLILMLL